MEILITGEANVTAKFAKDSVKMFGGSGSEEAHSIDYTMDGGMVLGGRSESRDGDFEGLKKSEYFSYVLKISASGEKEWIKSFNGSDHFEGVNSVIQTSDGGYIFTGNVFPNSSSENVGQGEVFVTKLTSSGDIAWEKVLLENNFDIPTQIVETSDGDFIVVGYSAYTNGDFQSLYHGGIDGFILKISPSGEQKWIRKYGGSSTDYIHSIAIADVGGYVVTGSTESNDGDLENRKNSIDNIYAMKVTTHGDIVWVNIFGRDSENYSNPTSAVSIINSSDGGFILTGNTTASDGDFAGIDNGFIKPYVIKLNSSGQKEWVTVYEGDFSIMRPSQVIETQDNGIVVTGLSNSNTEIYHP